MECEILNFNNANPEYGQVDSRYMQLYTHKYRHNNTGGSWRANYLIDSRFCLRPNNLAAYARLSKGKVEIPLLLPARRPSSSWS